MSPLKAIQGDRIRDLRFDESVQPNFGRSPRRPAPRNLNKNSFASSTRYSPSIPGIPKLKHVSISPIGLSYTWVARCKLHSVYFTDNYRYSPQRSRDMYPSRNDLKYSKASQSPRQMASTTTNGERSSSVVSYSQTETSASRPVLSLAASSQRTVLRYL